MCNQNSKVNQSLIYDEKDVKNFKKSFDLDQSYIPQKNNIKIKSKEKFKFIEKKDLMKVTPIKLKPIFSKKLKQDKNSASKCNLNFNPI